MSNVFKDFLNLVVYRHDNVHLKWKVSPLDLNSLSIEYLCFDYLGYIFWATMLNSINEKVQMNGKMFSNFLENALQKIMVFNGST
jgi:hypothetical protein